MWIMFLFLITASVIHADESSIRFLKADYAGASKHYLGLNYCLAGDNYRIQYQENFRGLYLGDRLGLNFAPFSFAFSTERDHPMYSINPAFLFYAFVLAFLGDKDKEGNLLSYGGLGPFASAVLLPQLLTNWSVRCDIVKQRFGVWAGPVTDYLANFPESILVARLELHGGAYVPFSRIGLTGSAAYDVTTNQGKYYVGLLLGNRVEKIE